MPQGAFWRRHCCSRGKYDCLALAAPESTLATVAECQRLGPGTFPSCVEGPAEVDQVDVDRLKSVLPPFLFDAATEAPAIIVPVDDGRGPSGATRTEDGGDRMVDRNQSMAVRLAEPEICSSSVFLMDAAHLRGVSSRLWQLGFRVRTSDMSGGLPLSPPQRGAGCHR